MGPEYLPETLKRIDRDEALAFDGWHLSHEVSFVKVFDTNAQLLRARRLLRMVDAANNFVTDRVPVPETEAPFHDVPAERREVESDLARTEHALSFAVRSDWMRELAVRENKTASLPSR